MVAHGLVYLLYLGQSARFFELQPGMIWPDGSWSLARIAGSGTIRAVANVACVVAAIGFATGGLGILASQAWWRTVIAAAAVFASVLILSSGMAPRAAWTIREASAC